MKPWMLIKNLSVYSIYLVISFLSTHEPPVWETLLSFFLLFYPERVHACGSSADVYPGVIGAPLDSFLP